MNLEAIKAVIAGHCKELHLASIPRHYPTVCRQAQDAGFSYEVFLKELLEAEVDQRRENAAKRRLKEAGFSEIKTIEQIDWDALEGIPRQKIMALSSGDFVKKGEDIILIGPIGTGKTHLAIAIGVEFAKRFGRVLFARAADLVRQLVEAKDDRQLGKLHQRLLNTPLLIIDELGFVPFDKMEGELLFNMLADRYEKRSTIITSNLAFGEWVQVFRNEKLTTALLDRLAHHAHVLTTKGKSFRTRRK